MPAQFERSEHTRRLIAAFTRMSVGEAISLKSLSASVGFAVTPANCYSARQIVEKEYKVFIFIDTNRGVVRGSGSDMVSSSASFSVSIRRKAKRWGRRMETALTQNLTRDEHYIASESLARANIVASTSAAVRAASNRTVPPQGEEAVPFNTAVALRKVK